MKHAVQPQRRLWVRGTLALAAFAAAGAAAAADAYPSKPITLVVPFAPGGPTDVMGRIVGEILGAKLGQTVVIENKPGAGGNLGTGQVARAKADGYTLALSAISSLAIAPGLYTNLQYDVQKNLTPITLVGIAKGAIVAHPSAPFNDLKGMVEYARANPGKLSYASSGIGTANHLAGEFFAGLAGIKMQHIPYKGTAQAAQDVLAGTVPLSFESSLTTAAQSVAAGKLKGIAITSAERSPLLPDVPTVAEQGYKGFDVPTWFGLVGPAGLPKDVVAKLNKAVNEGLQAPDVKERFAKIGAEPAGTTPEKFDAYIRSETARWGKLIKERGIKPE